MVREGVTTSRSGLQSSRREETKEIVRTVHQFYYQPSAVEFVQGIVTQQLACTVTGDPTTRHWLLQHWPFCPSEQGSLLSTLVPTMPSSTQWTRDVWVKLLNLNRQLWFIQKHFDSRYVADTVYIVQESFNKQQTYIAPETSSTNSKTQKAFCKQQGKKLFDYVLKSVINQLFSMAALQGAALRLIYKKTNTMLFKNIHWLLLWMN